MDGLYFALPTRAAARQIHRRIERALQRLIDPAIGVTLAIPGYAPLTADEPLPDPHILLDDDERTADRDAQWASERPKRFLASFAAVGTIDQALLGALRVRHAQLRSSLLLRCLLVVDEVHASDSYMMTILRSLLEQHRRSGGHALLMSATLGSAARARLLRPFAPPVFNDFASVLSPKFAH